MSALCIIITIVRQFKIESDPIKFAINIYIYAEGKQLCIEIFGVKLKSYWPYRNVSRQSHTYNTTFMANTRTVHTECVNCRNVAAHAHIADAARTVWHSCTHIRIHRQRPFDTCPYAILRSFARCVCMCVHFAVHVSGSTAEYRARKRQHRTESSSKR